MNENKCPRCSGKGTITKTNTEPDTYSGIIYGVALGMGYLPRTRTVTTKTTCPDCNGTGEKTN